MNGPDGKRFVWGRIIEVHSIGPYEIVEFRPGPIKGPALDENLREFHVFIAGKDASVAAPTLDLALLLAIAYVASAGNDPSAARYAARALGMLVTI